VIGIGRGLTASPRPHHRTYGSRLRRCGRCRQGDRRPPTGASSPAVPVGRSSQRPGSARPRAGGDCATPPRAATPLSRAGLRRAHAPTLPAADVCGAVREACSALRPEPGPPADLPGSVSTPAAPSRLIYTAYPQGREDVAVPCPLVPGKPRLRSGSWTSPRAFVPRGLQTPPGGDALALPWSFGSTSLDRGLAPPSTKTCPAHTARPEPRGSPRRLHALVRLEIHA
jgi:hypothetical protein